MRVSAAALTIAGALGLAAGAVGAAIARQISTAPRIRKYRTTILGSEDKAIELSADEYTRAPGQFGLFLDETSLAHLGEVISDNGRSVTRALATPERDWRPAPNSKGSWSGIIGLAPDSHQLPSKEISIPTPGGPAPAWLIPGTDPHLWAIHVHGLGGRRASTLRSAELAHALGFTSLIVSYRNDGEGPSLGTGRSSLGFGEANDVNDAISYARRQGATRIVLFGWSMGAAISLQVAVGTHRELVAGLVLDSPVLDWRRTTRHALKRQRLSVLAPLAYPWLGIPLLGRLVGIPSTGGLDRFDWIANAERFPAPALIVQSASDRSVPSEAARKLAEQQPNLVELALLDGGHTTTWNTDRSRWDNTVARWLRKHDITPSDHS
jgi:pimeloyl-ACP methyl ester carboxylesterase